MTATSTIDAAVKALVAAIAANATVVAPVAGVDPVLVLNGPQGVNNPPDIISVGERVDVQWAPHALVGGGGPNWLEEPFQVSVMIKAYRAGDDATVSRARAQTLLQAVHDVVRGDPSLTGSVLAAWPLSARYETVWDTAGFITTVDADIHCLSIP